MTYHVLPLRLVSLIGSHCVSNILVPLLDVVIEVSSVVGQLASFKLYNVRANFVQKASVMAHL